MKLPDIFGIDFWIWQFIFFPVILGIVSFLVNTAVSRRRELSRVKELWAYIESMCNNSILVMEENIVILEKFKKHFDELCLENLTLSLKHDFNNVLSIDNEDLYKAFVLKRKPGSIKHQVLFSKFLTDLNHTKLLIESADETTNQIFSEIEDLGKSILAVRSEKSHFLEVELAHQVEQLKVKSHFETNPEIIKKYLDTVENIEASKTNILAYYVDLGKRLTNEEIVFDHPDIIIFTISESVNKIIECTKSETGIQYYFSPLISIELKIIEKALDVKTSFEEHSIKLDHFILQLKENTLLLKSTLEVFKKLKFKIL